MKVFVSPHDDDHALFGAFTCLREHPTLVVVFDGHVQGLRGCKVTAEERARETALAADILECSRVVRLGFSDADPNVTVVDILNRLREAIPVIEVGDLYLPAHETDGHEQHNLCSYLAGFPFNPVVTHYLTYTRENGKSTSGRRVSIEQGDWIASKLRALAEYTSQHSLDPRLGCWSHFLRDQTEYYAS